MRNILLFVVIFVCLFGYSSPATEAIAEPTSSYELPTLVVPEIPLDDNPFRREVFSLKEVREGDPKLLKRIVTTRMDFPMMFDPFGRFASELFPNPSRTRFGKNFEIVIWIDSLLWMDDSVTLLKALKGELEEQGLDQGRADKELRIEQMVFLKNYKALCEYAGGYPEASDEARAEVVEAFGQVYDVCKQVIEFKALTLNGIQTLDVIDERSKTEAGAYEELEFERFLMESKDMKPDDFASILEIRNPAQFKELCLKRTSEMMADTDGQDVEELLANIEPSDAIVLASYFARSRVQKYKKPADQMADLYQELDREDTEEDEELTAGDCRYFAGLTVHYLNLVVKPDNSKFDHWHFGIERENVSDYHHAYVKAAHIYKEDGKEKIDLFFFDPVALSSKPLGKLKDKDIRRLIDAASRDNHFFYIKRYGEDFVAHQYESRDSAKGRAQPITQTREISFETIMAD